MNIRTALLFIVFSAFALVASAQRDSNRSVVAVFAPLYLDSAFDAAGEYKYGKLFPKFINPGLEFYEGVQLAADSLMAEHVQLDVHVFDTRSSRKTLQQQISEAESLNAGLFIGHVTPAESRLLAASALRKTIPFINANLPNDAGIVNNASLVLLNTTLKTHCESIYRFLQKNYPLAPILYFGRRGQQEERLKQYFLDYEKATAGAKLRIKFLTLDDQAPALKLTQYLDSTRQAVIIAGSLDEVFGKRIVDDLVTNAKGYPLTVMGMPTWDGSTDLNKKEYKALDIIYSTPFYNARTDKASLSITEYFKDQIYARPSDMVFRGYECLYRFGKLLVEKKSNLVSSIGEKKYKVFTDFDIQPVLNKQTMALDYFENKKVYFVRRNGGEVTMK